jgi:S-adenosylmethionine:tRNA ribosyltransferase-isomerase
VSGLTRLFVAPPDAVPAADGLITNFHLPGSSLLMLLAAFLGGTDRWRPAYARAVDGDWRFYSYGDAMLVLPDAAATPQDGR